MIRQQTSKVIYQVEMLQNVYFLIARTLNDLPPVAKTSKYWHDLLTCTIMKTSSATGKKLRVLKNSRVGYGFVVEMMFLRYQSLFCVSGAVLFMNERWLTQVIVVWFIEHVFHVINVNWITLDGLNIEKFSRRS